MFAPPSRPRPPSIATLRILYQLAYITSGTALGASIICIEERRRRIKILQKIADNARRLRQCPRYIHNVALAPADINDNVGLDAIIQHSNGARSWDQPSRIDEAYEKMMNVQPRKRKRRKRVVESQEQLAGKESETASRHETSMFGAESNHTLSSIYSPFIQRGHDKDRGRETLTRARERSERERVSSVPISFTTTKLQAARVVAGKPQNTLPTLHESDVRRKESSLEKRAPMQSEGRILYQTTAQANDTTSQSRSSHRHSKTARGVDDAAQPLHHLTVEGGSQDKGGDTPTLGRRETASSFMARPEFEEFEDGLDRKQPPTNLQESTAKPLTSPSHNKPRLNRIIQQYTEYARSWQTADASTPALTPVDLDWAQDQIDVATLVERECNKLLGEGLVAEAVSVSAAFSFRAWPETTGTPYARTLFAAALASHSVPSCVKIIKWTGGDIKGEVISRSDVNKFIAMASEQKQHKSIRALFVQDLIGFNNTPMLQHSSINEFFTQDSLMSICIAFSESLNRSDSTPSGFKSAFLALTNENKRSMRGQALPLYTSWMLADWQNLRNFGHTMTTYNKLIIELDYQNEAGLWLHLAMIDVCLAANRLDVAQLILSRVRSFASTAATTLAMSKIYAKQKMWETLTNQLVEIHQNDLLPNGIESDLHDEVGDLLSTISRYHNLEEVKAFGNLLVRAFGEATSSEVAEVLLRKSIAEKQRHKVKACAQMIEKDYKDFSVSPDATAAMVEHFYNVWRANAGTMTWIWNTLLKYAPWTVNRQLQNVIDTALVDRKMKNDRKTASEHESFLVKMLYERGRGVVATDLGQLKTNNMKRKSMTAIKKINPQHSLQELKVTFARGHDEAVLEWYHHITRGGTSTSTLKTAIESSLRMHEGDPTHAWRLVSQAKEDGTNVSCAMAPLLLHRLDSLSRDKKSRPDLDALRRDVMEYQFQRADCGLPIDYSVLVSVAAHLNAIGLERDAIKILESTDLSPISLDWPPDEEFMHVWFQAYLFSCDIAGMERIVHRILSQNMKVLPHLRALLRMAKVVTNSSKRLTQRQKDDFMARVMRLRELCSVRAEEQYWGEKHAAVELVRMIAKFSKTNGGSDFLARIEEGDALIAKMAEEDQENYLPNHDGRLSQERPQYVAAAWQGNCAPHAWDDGLPSVTQVGA